MKCPVTFARPGHSAPLLPPPRLPSPPPPTLLLPLPISLPAVGPFLTWLIGNRPATERGHRARPACCIDRLVPAGQVDTSDLHSTAPSWWRVGGGVGVAVREGGLGVGGGRGGGSQRLMTYSSHWRFAQDVQTRAEWDQPGASGVLQGKAKGR